MDPDQIHWGDGMSSDLVREVLYRVSELIIDGWDGYCTEAARTAGVETVLAIDSDHGDVAEINANATLTPEDSEPLGGFLI